MSELASVKPGTHYFYGPNQTPTPAPAGAEGPNTWAGIHRYLGGYLQVPRRVTNLLESNS
ncbi:hypothetical protein PCASD_05054 [Puccinia coronata f. sp. avenae]|uniref:Uncharacterized protein n=1 Tax=Puccinia coronata f. sp. avenae TaxID=200324 RepID=A0A2N5VGB1_9BASI|nr:hypothetical protein PCASD_05054 [Puccinia coronata f. sp. avenae]